MKKKTRNTIIGGIIGTGAGMVLAGVRVGAAFCPPMWPVASTVVFGQIGYAAKGEVGMVIGATFGFGLGCAEVAVAPITSAVMIMQAPLFVPIGTAVGAAIGYNESK